MLWCGLDGDDQILCGRVEVHDVHGGIVDDDGTALLAVDLLRDHHRGLVVLQHDGDVETLRRRVIHAIGHVEEKAIPDRLLVLRVALDVIDVSVE